MEAIRSREDAERFLEENREKIRKIAIRLEDLPQEDEWFQDDGWDEIYRQEVVSGKV